MVTSNQLEVTDYQKLSSGYRQWLTSVGVVNISILALVIFSGKKAAVSELHLHYASLIGSLFVGIFSCFIGSFLMVEIEAVRKDKEASHLFMIASVNIHVAVILFFLSTMLLATVHRDLLVGNDVSAVIFSMLAFVELTCLVYG